MEDTPVTIIGIVIASILMFVIPLVTIADRNDDISQLTVQTATSKFVDNVVKKGKLTDEDYQNYLLEIASSGNTYEADLEIQILDENPAKKTTDTTSGIGTNAYYSIYTSQIEDELQKDKRETGIGQIVLKEGDIISVTAKNSSKTVSQTLKNIYYTISGDELHIIYASGTGTIAINGAT